MSLDILRGNLSFCPICEIATSYTIHGPWLRDQFVCDECGSIPRQRAIQLVLARLTGFDDSLEIHESRPSNNFIEKKFPKYSSSQYFEGKRSGEVVSGTRCENLEKLSFRSNSFDVFVTQDVFEHVFSPDRAAKEIARVLRPGGFHIFTAPKHLKLVETRTRAISTRRGIKHLLPAEYHGNPVGDGRSLVTWDYGQDFEQLYSRWSSCNLTTFIHSDFDQGLAGEYLEVFVAHKPRKYSLDGRQS